MASTHKAKANRYNFALAFFVALGSFSYGFNSSIIGSVIGQPSFYSYMNFVATSNYGGSIIGAANGMYAAAGVIGSLSVFWMLDVMGRKKGIQIAALLCLISAAVQAGSVHIAMFLVGRFFNGLAIGWINCSVPIYISEISPASQRGRIVGSHGFVICCGYAVSNWCGFGTFYETNGTIQWRLLLALQCVAPLLLALGSPWVPESPRWLVNNGRHDEGLSVLEKLHANADDPQHVNAKVEFTEIRAQLVWDRSHDDLNTFWKMMKAPTIRKRMLYGFWTQAACQSTGVLVIANYMFIILGNLGISPANSLMLLAFYNTWAAFLNWINSLIIDRFGRKPIIIGCLVGCVCVLIVETILVSRYGGAGNTNKVGSGFALLFIFLFATFYGCGLDVSSYVYCCEIFPTSVRAKGVGFSTAGLFLMTTRLTDSGANKVVTSAMLPLIIFKFPETKGLSLEEIGVLFGDEAPVNSSQPGERDDMELRQGSNDTDLGTKKTSELDHVTSTYLIEDAEKGHPL
ncbi:hypothetical protein H2204_002772 [Knufia peltigerae]|uniref:Major facilitator superfamily (MFS) profile domain-containing protein n=1 Tax=Knufia peltigerae TaxID=1002370 RepID=A0AA38YAY5_9EURO|nr:hypothetical protein H2204_002772 [Knufia peltigerae]